MHPCPRYSAPHRHRQLAYDPAPPPEGQLVRRRSTRERKVRRLSGILRAPPASPPRPPSSRSTFPRPRWLPLLYSPQSPRLCPRPTRPPSPPPEHETAPKPTAPLRPNCKPHTPPWESDAAAKIPSRNSCCLPAVPQPWSAQILANPAA